MIEQRLREGLLRAQRIDEVDSIVISVRFDESRGAKMEYEIAQRLGLRIFLPKRG